MSWDLCLWGGSIASTKCSPNRGTASPRVAHRPLRPFCLFLEICPSSSPEHHQALSSKTSDSALHCLQNPGGIETLSFPPIKGFGEQISCSDPCERFHYFSLFLSSYFQGSAFLAQSQCATLSPFSFSVLSLQKQLPTLHRPSLPQFASPTAHLLSSVAQVTQIVVLVLRSIS